MEWAEPLEAAAPGALELQVLADDLVDPAALPHQGDVGGPDPPPAGHQPAVAAAEAALRRRRISSTHSRKTCASRAGPPARSSVGRGTQRLVLPLFPISRPSRTYRRSPFHQDPGWISR